VTAVGMSGMLENADSTSTQQIITYVFDETLEEGSVVTVSDSSGNEIATITLIKSANCITYSSADLVSGETYTFSCGDVSGEITAEDINATNSSGGMGMGGFGGGQGGGMGGQGGPGNMGGQGGPGNMSGAPGESQTTTDSQTTTTN